MARNWPLASFAYSSEHGLLNHLIWDFDDDGLCKEGHYQEYTISPLLHKMELLYSLGIDHYDRRFHDILHSRSAVASLGKSYGYKIVKYIDENRFAGKDFMKRLPPETDGLHLCSITKMRWKGFEVTMNWATHIMRSNADRSSLIIKVPKELAGLNIGGTTYSHSTLGQSSIIVDEDVQTCMGGYPLSADVDGPVQHVMARSDKDYPGTSLTRTFALIEKHILVVDRAESEKERTIDWCLRNAGGEVSVELEEKAGSFTDKPGNTASIVSYGGELNGYLCGKTDGDWTEGGGRMTMLGEKGTEIHIFNVDAMLKNLKAKGEKASTLYDGTIKDKKKKQSPYLMVRRKGVKKTDFVTFLSLETKSVERVPVKKADGKDADAVGVKITLKDGKTFHALVSYEPENTEVQLGELKTTDRFATDYEK
jgi:hypothetical protein